VARGRQLQGEWGCKGNAVARGMQLQGECSFSAARGMQFLILLQGECSFSKLNLINNYVR